MTTLTAYDALRDWFDANWPFTPQAFENEGAYPPPGANGAPPPFVHMAVEGYLFWQLSIGAGSPQANLWRETGRAIFTVCVETGSGVSLARGYAQTLADMMRGLALAPGLQCQDMRITAGNVPSGAGNYYAAALVTEWYRDEPTS
jgi:hypothetical protein